mmetsp:Transcript_105167/g.307394  ORF Transcript_105167/g.307394 Transcript_105167/m.307394 type:complete len:677 (+) Transcript_105167:100-2130(+)
MDVDSDTESCGPESCGPEETLEEKLDSFLRDEELASLLADASGVTPSCATPPDFTGGGDAPHGDASAGGEARECPAAEVPDSSHAEPVASLADMATLALQLEAMRALAIAEAETDESPGTQALHGTGTQEGTAIADPPAGPNSAQVAELASDRESNHAGEAADGEVQMVSARRWDLQRSIFRALDCDRDGRLGCAELLHFARLTGFDGPEDEWAEEYKDLCACHAGGDEGGPTLPCFRAMVDDTSDEGFHCTDKELGAVQAKLRQAVVPLPPAPEPPEEPPLSIPLELLTPGPRAAPPPEILPLEDLPADEAAPQTSPLPAEDGEAGSGALDEVYDLSQMHRRDQPDVIDVEELLQYAWDAREADGERLGDSGDEGEDEEEVETWGDADPHPRPAGGGNAAAIVPVFNRAQEETDVVTEAVSNMETELETEMATEVLVGSGSKASLPARRALQPALGDDSTLLDELLVQAGVPHLAERDAAKERSKRPLQQEVAGQRPLFGGADRPAKSTRRGALRGGAAAVAPSNPAQAEDLAALRLELLQLRAREAMEDPRAIPKLAGRINMAHLPVIGAPKVLNTMATTFIRQDVTRPHKLAILYVFHEMLLYNAHTTEFVADSAKYFLEALGDTVAHVSADKLGPFLKLLGMWRHVYTDRYLAHLKQAWTGVSKASAARRLP